MWSTKIESLRKRLDRNTEKTQGCWKWLGSLQNAGYGQVRFRGKQWLVHRLSFLAENGYIDDDKYCLHKCDNRSCIRPDHLYLGNGKDNMRDARDRKRLGPRVKLDMKKADEIRASDDRAVDIASTYGVSQAMISMIRHGRCWQKT